MAIVALTDIHGRYDCLVAMRDKLAGILEGSDHTLILCGDYMDRGPQSKEVMEAVVAGKLFFTFAKEVICLKGNHEEIFLDAINDNHWNMLLNNGGWVTMASLLGVEKSKVSDAIFVKGTKTNLKYDHRINWIVSFIKDLPIYHKIGKYFFVHAGVNPHIPIEDQTRRIEEYTNYFMWVRDAFLNQNKDQGYTIIHGHTPHSYDHWRGGASYRVNLDSGASYTGLLSAAIIRDPNDRDAYDIVTVKLPSKDEYDNIPIIGQST